MWGSRCRDTDLDQHIGTGHELKHLQEKVGITFIHATHNKEEAMTVADRIALVADGLLVEHGTPNEIYEAPRKRA